LTARPAAASPGALLFFGLLAVILVVATLVVRARTPDLVLEVTSISPRHLVLDGVAETRIRFFVREGDRTAKVGIVDGERRVVRTLAAPVALEPDREVVYRWDARDDAGRPVLDGHYRLRVRLPDRDRDMVWPRRITVERTGGDRGPGEAGW
jgi:hypothetical protein